jgi:hypothetical protein
MKKDVFAIAHIIDWLPDDLKNTSRVALSNALVRCGAVRNSSPVRLSAGKQVKLMAIQNLDYWRERVGKNKEWAENFERKARKTGKVTPIGGRKGRKSK